MLTVIVLLAGVACVQIYSVFPCESSQWSLYSSLISSAVLTIPAGLPKKNLESHQLYSAWTESVRDLASDNIMCAVMLTGVMLLQV